MRNLHESLQLQHHRHTGKLLHHKHTSYRALAVVLVLAGVFIAALNVASRAAADTFGISAMVGVSVPSDPPIISSPVTGASMSGPSVLVTGSCPLVTPQVVVSVSVDGTQSGTSSCDTNNDFSVPITVGAGTHQIAVRSLTIAGQKGPSSAPLGITTTASVASAIAISSDSPFVYADGNDITWSGTVGVSDQNTEEYVHVDWGDNSQSNYSVKAGRQSFSHNYESSTPHNILVAVSDVSNASSSEQFAEAGYSAASFPAAVTTTTPLANTRVVAGLYGLYLSVLCVMILIWAEAKHSTREYARQHATA